MKPRVSFADSFSGKNVFITGHTGFKGSWLAAWLVHLGASVTGFSKDSPNEPSPFGILQLDKKLKDLRGDIRDLSALKSAIELSKPDFVFHLAAQAQVRSSYDDPVSTFHENILGTANLLEALRVFGKAKAAVIVTTDKVYKDLKNGHRYSESDMLGGLDPYSASKAATELVVSSYVGSFFKNGTKICTARAGNVIGGGDWASERLVPDCVRAWAKGGAFKPRNPSHIRPWQFVLDPLWGYMALAESMADGIEGIHGEAFNFGPLSSDDCSVGDLIQKMADKWPSAMISHERGSTSVEKIETSDLKLDCRKVFERVGWTPILNLDKAIAFTMEWYCGVSKGRDFLRSVTLKQIMHFEENL